MFSAQRASSVYLPMMALLSGMLPTAVSALVGGNADAVAEDPVRRELMRSLDSRSLPGSTALDFTALEAFYSKREYQSAWCDVRGVHFNTQRWLAILGRIDRQSPNASLHHLADIQHLLNAAAPRECAMLDLLLSDSFLRYVRDATRSVGIPAEMHDARHFSRPVIDPAQVLEAALQSGQFAEAIARLEPQHAAYQRLREQLAHYLGIHAHGGWPGIPAVGERLELGSESNEVPKLRELLIVTGDLVAGEQAGVLYDAALEQGIRRFQQRHGLTADGIVGKATRAALAEPVEHRIGQLRINLERWRWLPHDLGERYITVNSAAFELQVHEGEQVPLSMRVIVGSRERETPVFVEDMSYLVVNPYWRVPSKIAKEDLIPALLRDQSYFERKGIQVLSDWGNDAVEVDASKVFWPDYLGDRYLPYQLRQAPGPRNSLGRIKFMMPNQHSVYLHDTPSRSLFKRPERAFSSGCIRVENPLALARYVLGGEPETAEILDAILASGDTRTVSLPEPIPVYFLYHTAWVDAVGNVHFRKDIYQRDGRLLAALNTAPAVTRSVSQPPDIEKVTLLHPQH